VAGYDYGIGRCTLQQHEMWLKSLKCKVLRLDGKVDWLEGQESTGAESESYDNFIKDIDTVIMGWNPSI